MATDTYEITGEFAEPFFTGAASAAAPERGGYPVSIAGRGFLIDWTSQYPFSRRSVNLLNTQQAQSGGDQAQTPPEVWRRAMESWHQGNGQKRLDRDDSLPFRFNTSQGIDVWTPWQFSLLHDVEESKTLATGVSRLLTLTGYVVSVVGSAGHWYDTSSGVWTTMSFGAAVIDATSDGTTLYVLMTDGTVKAWTGPAASSTFMAAAVASFSTTRSFIAVVKGFLLLGNMNVLYDATSGTATSIYTHPNVNHTWTGACDGQGFGYATGGSGDRWHVWALALKADSTTFDPPRIAATLPDGERITAIAAYLDFVLIGSMKGFRLASPDSSGALTYGRLVLSDAAVECFEGQDRFVWFGRSVTSGSSGLGRADLSTFTAPLTPAVADDLLAPGSGRVGGVVTVGDRRMFSLDDTAVYLESDDFVAEGHIDFGLLTFGSTDRKQGMYIQLVYDPLSDGTVELSYSKDGGTFSSVAQSVTGVTMGNVPVQADFSTIEVRVTLTRSSTTTTVTPVVSRSEVRALVVPGRASEWTIPVILADSVEYDGGTQERNVIEDQDFLRTLVDTRAPFTFREGSRQWALYASDFYWLPRHESDGARTFAGTFVLLGREIL